MAETVQPGEPEEPRRSGWESLEERQVDQDRTLAAIHQLEAALEEGAPGRELRWRGQVLGALGVLARVTAEEAVNADRPGSLLSEIATDRPWLRARVHGVRAQYRQLQDRMASLRDELEETEDFEVDVADLRRRLGWVTAALRHQRARESDLIYEALAEAARADPGPDGEDRDADEEP
ncbi:MAG TPA: hypothetical protein VE152_08045 [Acidimicrobiales bacterium]|nr:hypothetical protein [Acidimicrobiales bacterium]